MFCRTASPALFLAYSQIFYQNQGFCSYQVVLIKKFAEDFKKKKIAKSPSFLAPHIYKLVSTKVGLGFDT